MSSDIIALRNINKSYGDKKVLKNLNLNIAENTFNVIMGQSGCGKSTLLNILGLADFADDGEFYYMREKINKSNKNLTEMRNQNIGFIFQSYCLIPNLSVYDNLLIPLVYRKKIVSGEIDKIDGFLDDLNILDLKNKKVDDLSGGEKQRVAICRTLVSNAKVILADEPTGNLDENNKKIITDIFCRLVKHYKKSIVVVTHDSGFQKFADKSYLLNEGALYEQDDV